MTKTTRDCTVTNVAAAMKKVLAIALRPVLAGCGELHDPAGGGKLKVTKYANGKVASRRHILNGIKVWKLCSVAAFAMLTPDIATAQEGYVTGRVIAADGTSVTSATVELRWFRYPELPEPVGRSLPHSGVKVSVHDVDKEGRFQIACTKQTKYSLLARGPDGKVSRLVYPVLPGESVALTLDAEAGLKGRVVDGTGQPVADADVEFRYGNVYMAHFGPRSMFGQRPASPMPALVSKTNSDGRFVLPPPTNEYGGRDGWIRARAPRLTTGWVKLPANATLELAPSPKPFRMQFQDEDGKPLIGVQVSLTQAPGHLAQSGADGTVELDEKPLALMAFKPGYPRIRVVDSTHPSRFLFAKGVIKLRRVKPKKLQLLNEKGAPLPFRRVLFAQRITQSVDPVFRDLHEWWDTTDGGGFVTIETDRRHALLSVFVEVEDRFVQVLCLDPHHEARAPWKLTPTCRLTIRPSPLVGRVVDATGKSLPHARVLLSPNIPDHSPQSTIEPLPRVEYTDRDGRFRFDHVAGLPQRLFIDAGPGVQLNVPDAVPQDWTVRVPAGIAVRGEVLLPEGKPAAGTWVGAFTKAAGENGGFVPSRFRWARVDRHGNYTVRISREVGATAYVIGCYSLGAGADLGAGHEGPLPPDAAEVTVPNVTLQKGR